MIVYLPTNNPRNVESVLHDYGCQALRYLAATATEAVSRRELFNPSGHYAWTPVPLRLDRVS